MQYNCSVQKRRSRTAYATDTMSACVHSTRTSSSGCTATCCALGPSSCPASGVGCSSCAPEHATHQLRTRNSLQHACFENLYVPQQPETSISSPPSSCGQHLLPASEQPKISPLMNMHTTASTEYRYHRVHENFCSPCNRHRPCPATLQCTCGQRVGQQSERYRTPHLTTQQPEDSEPSIYADAVSAGTTAAAWQ
jgi:hypothetical protein